MRNFNLEDPIPDTKGWDYSTVPEHYYYRDILVKRIERGKGMIELVA